MGGISKRRRASRQAGIKGGVINRQRKLKAQLGERYHSEIHGPV